jgi:EAL and modified HD-GYP domain-containing signal transduction protein
MLDAILGRPLDAVIADLPLSRDTKDALLGASNPSRHVLDAVINYERGAWNEVGETARSVGLTEEDIGDAYHTALSWARAIETTTAA